MASLKIIGQVGVKVIPDTTNFKSDLKRDLEKIEKSLKDLKVNVVPDVDKAAVEKVKAEMERLREALDGNVLLSPELNNADTARVTALLDVLVRDRKVKIEPNIDEGQWAAAATSLMALGGARVGIDAVRESLEKLAVLDQLVPQIALMATKITLVGAAALATTGHILSLSASLTSISGAALAAPGIFGGIAIGLGTMVTALTDFNLMLPGVTRKFSLLKAELSENFWEVALKPIREMVNTLWPAFSKGILDTATALGGFFANLADSMTALAPALGPMFDSLVKSIQNFSQYTDAIVGVIVKLGTAGSQYLPALATWLGDIITRFNEWLSDGDRLTGWIDNGVKNLQALGNVIIETSRIFGGLADAAAAAGGATLTSLADGLRSIADTVNSPGFQSGLTATFEAAFETMRNLGNGSGDGIKAALLSIRDLFIEVGPQIGSLVGDMVGALGTALADPKVGENVRAMFDGITQGMATLTPTIEAGVMILASLGPVVGALAANIAGLLAGTGDRLVPTFDKITRAIVPVINTLGGLFQKVMSDLTPVFQELGDQVAKVIKQMEPWIAQIQEMWNLISPVLIPTLKILAQILGDALVGVIQGVTMYLKGTINIIKGVIDVFKGLWDVVAGIFTLDFSRIRDGFGKMFDGLGEILLGALQTIFGGLWAYLNGTVVGLFRKALAKVALPFASVAAKILGPFEKIGELLWKPIAAAFEKVIGFIKPFINYIRTGFMDGTKTVGTVWSRLKEVLLYPFQIVGGFIKKYVEGWVAIFSRVFGVIKTVVSTAWSVIKEVFTAAFDVIGITIRNAWGGIVEFFRSSLNAVYATFKGTWDDIALFLTELWTSIVAGAKILWEPIKSFFDDFLLKMRVRFEMAWDAIKSKLTAAWEAIKSTATNMWNSIKSFFVNTLSDIRAAFGRVIDAIKQWVRHRWELMKADAEIIWSAVKNRLTSIWDNIKGVVGETWEAIRNRISNAWESIKTKVGNAVESIKTSMADAWEAVKTKIGTAWENIKTAVGNKVADVVAKVGKIPEDAKNALTGIGTALFNAGKDLIQGFLDGIAELWDDLQDKLDDLGDLMSDLNPLGRVMPKVGKTAMESLQRGLESKYGDVRASLTGFASDIASEFDTGSNLRLGVAADLAVSGRTVSAIAGLGSTIGAAFDAAEISSGNVQIDNITIPLEDLQQLKTLEEFLDMLRVRTRQGVLA